MPDPSFDFSLPFLRRCSSLTRHTVSYNFLDSSFSTAQVDVVTYLDSAGLEGRRVFHCSSDVLAEKHDLFELGITPLLEIAQTLQRSAASPRGWAISSVGSTKTYRRTRIMATLKLTTRINPNLCGVSRVPMEALGVPTDQFLRHGPDFGPFIGCVSRLCNTIFDLSKISTPILCAAHVHRRKEVRPCNRGYW